MKIATVHLVRVGCQSGITLWFDSFTGFLEQVKEILQRSKKRLDKKKADWYLENIIYESNYGFQQHFFLQDPLLE